MRLGRLIKPLAIWAVLCLPATALAEQGTVFFKNGATLQGDIVNYQPGQPITVRNPDGSLATYSADDVERVEMAPVAQPPPAAAPPPAVAPAPAPAPAPYPTAPGMAPPVQDPRINELMAERRRYSRRPGLALPIVLMAVGGGLVAIGGLWWSVGSNTCGSLLLDDYYDDDDCDSADGLTGGQVAGVVFWAFGGTMIALGGGLGIPLRIAKRARYKRKLQAIDEELRSLGVQQLSLRPSIPVAGNGAWGMTMEARF